MITICEVRHITVLESGGRRSKKREAILEAIRSTKSHPSAEWVYAKLKPQIPDLSLGTVYRNIALFKQEGTIIAVADVAGSERVDGDTSPHAHFVCTLCGEVMDIMGLEEKVALDRAARELFEGKIESHSLVYYGRCKACIKPKA